MLTFHIFMLKNLFKGYVTFLISFVELHVQVACVSKHIPFQVTKAKDTEVHVLSSIVAFTFFLLCDFGTTSTPSLPHTLL